MIYRPFRILGLQQIAIGGTDQTRLRRPCADTLGVPATGNYRSEHENVDEDILALGSDRTEVDFMQPEDIAGRQAVHETPVNHIGLWLDDRPEAVEWLAAKGLRFALGGLRRGGVGYDICFVHPRGNDEFPLCGEGALVELAQAPAELVAGPDR